MWIQCSLMAAALFSPLATSALPEQESSLVWHDDYDAATREAHESGRPVLLVFR